MRASRGMGDIAPSKMPGGKRKPRRDNTDFTEYAKGGWIKDAIKKPGALRQQLGVKGDAPIPAKTLAKAAKAPGKLGQRARLAQTLKKMR
jgi:hypothetical protein